MDSSSSPGRKRPKRAAVMAWVPESNLRPHQGSFSAEVVGKDLPQGHLCLDQNSRSLCWKQNDRPPAETSGRP